MEKAENRELVEKCLRPPLILAQNLLGTLESGAEYSKYSEGARGWLRTGAAVASIGMARGSQELDLVCSCDVALWALVVTIQLIGVVTESSSRDFAIVDA